MIFALKISWQDIAVYTSGSVLVHCTTIKCYPMTSSYKSDVYFIFILKARSPWSRWQMSEKDRVSISGIAICYCSPQGQCCVLTIWKGLSAFLSLLMHRYTIYRIELYCFVQVCFSILLYWEASFNMNFERDTIG